MSRVPEKYHSCWSDPILRRPVQFAITSEEDNSSLQSTSPQLRLNKQSPIGCACCDQLNNQKKLKLKPQNRGETQRLRESLELELVGTQVEEALAGDRQASLIQHLSSTTSAIEALIQHVQSLEVNHLSTKRVLDLTAQLVYPHASNSIDSNLDQVEVERENRLAKLKEIHEICLTITCDQLQALIDDHQQKREDFVVAAKNFKDLLSKSKLNVAQMEKLHRQYDSILGDYQRSRHALDLELPKMVKMRLCVLQQGFQLINQFYNDFENTKIGNAFKLMADNLLRDDLTKENIIPQEELQVQEICQKCKVNRVDKK